MATVFEQNQEGIENFWCQRNFAVFLEKQAFQWVNAEHVKRVKTLWEELLRRLRAHIAKEIEWFRGREIDMVNDRPLAIFDGPARAIRCALAITEYASRLGVETRAGLHTGECEIVNGKVSGAAAEIGECVANEAKAGEVLVSSTVKDLVAGSGINFEDRGIQVMSDCGEWRLFAVQRSSAKSG